MLQGTVEIEGAAPRRMDRPRYQRPVAAMHSALPRGKHNWTSARGSSPAIRDQDRSIGRGRQNFLPNVNNFTFVASVRG
jgi:hypothetical protein